jgi:hypothetical protein
LQTENLFEKKPELRQKCLELISSSLAKRTWQKYSSALALWERFAKNEKVKGFPALAFVCWCSKNTKLKTTTIKSYLTALRKIKFLLGFRSKKEGQEMEKIILRGMENIEGINAKPPQQVTPVNLKTLSSIKRGLKKKLWKKCTKKSVRTLNVIAFWGLLRLGEVLPGKAESFDKTLSFALGRCKIFKKESDFEPETTKNEVSTEQNRGFVQTLSQAFLPG